MSSLDLNFRDFLSGIANGVATTLSGHPLDIIKTRMQATSKSQTAMTTLQQTLFADGFKGLFKGMSYPLYSQPLIQAVVFGSYHQAQRFIGAPEDK